MLLVYSANRVSEGGNQVKMCIYIQDMTTECWLCLLNILISLYFHLLLVLIIINLLCGLQHRHRQQVQQSNPGQLNFEEVKNCNCKANTICVKGQPSRLRASWGRLISAWIYFKSGLKVQLLVIPPHHESRTACGTNLTSSTCGFPCEKFNTSTRLEKPQRLPFKETRCLRWKHLRTGAHQNFS